MTTDSQPINPELDLVITREFNAPRELVWAAFTQPDHVAKWFGPRGFNTRVEQLEAKVGGKTRYVMVGPDGKEYPCEGVYREIVAPEYFVTTDEFGEDYEGPTVEGIILTARFENLGDRTRLTMILHHPSVEARRKHEEMGVVGGWGSSFDCLDDLLAKLTSPQGEANEIIVSRVLSAPRELVFATFTDPQQVTFWWGPRGFTTTTHHSDIRTGGEWRFTMHGPDGTDYLNYIQYDEVTPPERLIYRHAGEEAHADVQFRSTVTFEEIGHQTRVTLKLVFASAEARNRIERNSGAIEGGHQTLARLAEHVAHRQQLPRHQLQLSLPSSNEVKLVREFDAPRELVFLAFTRPEHIQRWWGCRLFEMTTCEMDFRVGGEWQFVQRSPDGQVHPFKGEYLEIVPNEKLVYTFIYDVDFIRDFPATETVTFEERDGRTILTNTVLHQTQESRDGHLNSGMESGATESMDRLEELVELILLSDPQQ